MFGGTCSPGTQNRLGRAQNEKCPPLPPFLTTTPSSVWDSPPQLQEGESGLDGPGWQPWGGGGKREDPQSRVQQLGVSHFSGPRHSRAPLSPSRLGDPGSPRPLQPISGSLSRFPDGSSPRAPILWGAVHSLLPPPRPSVLHESVRAREPLGTLVSKCPLRPRRALGRPGTRARLWPRLLFQVR